MWLAGFFDGELFVRIYIQYIYVDSGTGADSLLECFTLDLFSSVRLVAKRNSEDQSDCRFDCKYPEGPPWSYDSACVT